MRRSGGGFEEEYRSTFHCGASTNTSKYATVVATGVSHGGGMTNRSLLSSRYEAVEAAGLGHGGNGFLRFNHGESVEEGFTANKLKLPFMITYAEAEAEKQYDEFNRLIVGSGRSNRHVREAGGRYVQQQQQFNNTKKKQQQQSGGNNIGFVMRHQQQQEEQFVSGEHYYYRGGYYWV